ncbi:AfsA-related hotdog domain-containing protein [Streptomyces scabiei]|uniref:AfsA-related hotdog domain-containing protein n=1 Tax=Streptomyces scabiei TaxID=1930 RepID=UPI001FF0BC41|nr:AfsA-related hotdog domain-containing protein [Streptomyces sp. LBUM 1480]
MSISTSALAPETAPVSPPAPEAELSYDATVPRTLVHRASIAEVFVTDSAQTGEDTYAVAAQLPRGHLIGEHSPAYDFTLLVEVVRQAGVLVAHRHMGWTWVRRSSSGTSGCASPRSSRCASAGGPPICGST